MSEQTAILKSAGCLASNGLYYGSSLAMQILIYTGLMEFAEKSVWCRDAYYRITTKGRDILNMLAKGGN